MRLSLEIFLGMIVVVLGSLDKPLWYIWLLPLACWWMHLHEKKDCFIIMLTVFIFACSLNIRQPAFQKIQKGEITYVNGSGFQVNHIFYRYLQPDFQVGDIVTVEGEPLAFSMIRNDGGFDEQHFLMGKGVKYLASVSKVEITGHRWHLSQWAKETLEKRSDSQLKDIYLYLLLGVKNEETDTLSQMAKELAVLHLFAISGMHFSLLQHALLRFLSFFVSEKTAAKLSLFFMGLYALILRGNVAAWRAYLTMLFKAFLPLTPLQRFGFVGCLFLCWQPSLVYQLAFIYTMTIYFLVILCHDLKNSGFFVYLGSMAVTTYFQFEIYPLGYLAGLFFSSVISFLFPLFFLDVLFGGTFSALNLLLYRGLTGAMRFCCEHTFSIVTGRPPLCLVICFYLSLVYAVYRLSYMHQKRPLLIPVSIGLLLITEPYLRPYGMVSMIDVGQGDCFLISLPFQKANLLIDTGGLDYQDVAAKRVIPFLKVHGISQIDAVYISHSDFDHCGALDSLKEHFKVQKVIADFDEDSYDEVILKQLNRYPSENTNDGSLVIDVKLGAVRCLFTGDISQATEKWLVHTYPDLKTDILKVAHHGSDSSSSLDFIGQLEGKVALISVGLHNRYHHPSKKVLRNLEAYGYEIWRTDEEGAVNVYFTKHSAWIEKRKN